MTDLREAMRAARNADASIVDVPEWGQKVYLRKLSVGEQIKLTEDSPSPAVASLRILLLSIVDEGGRRLLDDTDWDLLLEQPFPVLLPLLAEAAKQNGLTTTELEEAVASFKTAPGEDSSSE